MRIIGGVSRILTTPFSILVFKKVFDGKQATWAAVQRGTAGKESFGVRVLGMVQDLVGVPFFDYRTVVHHSHLVGNLGNNAEVVGDEYDAHVVFLLKGAEEVENGFLDSDIKGGGGFVGDEQVGVADECHRNHDALFLPAADFMGVAAVYLFRSRKHDLLEQLYGALARLLPRHLFVRQQHFFNLFAASLHRVEAGHGLLENHCSPPCHIGPMARNLGIFWQQAHDSKGGDRFAAPRFAHNAQGLPTHHLERDAFHGLKILSFMLEGDMQIVNFQYCIVHLLQLFS